MDTCHFLYVLFAMVVLQMYHRSFLCVDKGQRLFCHRVDFVDGFGRERRCLRKDLPALKKLDESIGKSAR